MKREIISRAKILMLSLEPGMVIDKDVSELAVKTIEDLIKMAKTEKGDHIIKLESSL
jgi:hypothetical protein